LLDQLVTASDASDGFST